MSRSRDSVIRVITEPSPIRYKGDEPEVDAEVARMIDVDVPVVYETEVAHALQRVLPHEPRSLYATARAFETIAAFYLQLPSHAMFDVVCHESFDGLPPHSLEAIEEFRAAVCTSDLDSCGAEYARLFLEPDSPCPAWESAWTGGMEGMSASHHDVVAWHARYGKTPLCAPYDPADHIAIELAFASFLAWVAIDGTNVEADYDAFVRSRLLNWVPRFANALRRTSRVALYQQLAKLTLAML